MKKLSILVTLLLTLVASAFAQLPDDARFDAPTTLVTQSDGESLRVMIDSLARTVGLTPIINLDEEQANKVVIYNIDQAKPFEQIWDILISQEGLDYVVQANDVIVVGTPEAVASLKNEQAPAPADTSAAIEQRVYPVTKSPEDIADLIVRVVPGVEAEALPAVGSILVRGTAEQQIQVESALEQFGAVTALDPLDQRVFSLSNAKASDVAKALQAILSAQVAEQAPAGAADAADGAADAGAADAGGLQGSGNLRYSVVAYDPTNTVVVRATPSILDQIAQLIPTLDSAQPQVNVQVRIQEISTNAAENLGIDLSAGLGNFATTLLDGGLNFVFDAQRALSGLNIGATLDTLETQNLSRRVNDANITVLNNQAATIQSGGRYEITLPGADENIQRTVEFGVKVTVTPRITNDGRIVLEVDATVDTPDSTIENVNFLKLAKQAVKSTVTVESGQTVLLGGLFGNQFSTTTQGVPLLSSIPLIGSAFTDTKTTKQNIELLLVVTADIIE